MKKEVLSDASGNKGVVITTYDEGEFPEGDPNIQIEAMMSRESIEKRILTFTELQEDSEWSEALQHPFRMMTRLLEHNIDPSAISLLGLYYPIRTTNPYEIISGGYVVDPSKMQDVYRTYIFLKENISERQCQTDN